MNAPAYKIIDHTYDAVVVGAGIVGASCAAWLQLKGMQVTLIERNSPGLTVGKPDRKMGQRGSHTADVIFDNVRVPAENIIGGHEGLGFKTAMKVLDKLYPDYHEQVARYIARDPAQAHRARIDLARMGCFPAALHSARRPGGRA